MKADKFVSVSISLLIVSRNYQQIEDVDKEATSLNMQDADQKTRREKTYEETITLEDMNRNNYLFNKAIKCHFIERFRKYQSETRKHFR